MISLQDARSRAAFTLLLFESLIPSAVPKTSYWQKLFPRPLLQLVTLKSQLGAVQRSSWSFWKRGSSGASQCCSGWQWTCKTASVSAGRSDNTGNSTKHGNNKHDAVMADERRGNIQRSKSAACVSHNTDATRIFESTECHHRLFCFHKKAEDVWVVFVAFSEVDALTNILRDHEFLLENTLSKH